MIKALVVDDDIMSRLVLIEFLIDYSEPDVARDGQEAVGAVKLEIQKETPYDLILLDIMMPNMDGIEALSKIREIESDLNINPAKKSKIIMVTAVPDEETKERSFNAKCDAYLTKPVDLQELFKKMTEFKLIQESS